ncbi:hypothetical protein N665_0014s0168 [Sinapis alba]|nr:hypothetical protein N665_0014s0168 [Sinapis alba]
MEEELKNFMKVWVSAIISIYYCYYLSIRFKAGVSRLLFILPVCIQFLFLPLCFSTLHFTGFTAFSLTWLANFKLILFSFDKGPLYPTPPNISHFICFTCFPIKLQLNPKPQIHLPKWVFAIRVAIFSLLLKLYDYKQYMSSNMLLVLYSLHVYLEFEILLAPLKILLTMALGCDLETQFGSDEAKFLGVLASFLVSGAVHELIFFYFTRESPTGEVTLFFVLHGVCTAAEVVAAKRTRLVRRWKMSVMVSRLLTVGFVVVTGGWLFFPPLIRSGMIERLSNELFLSTDFVKQNVFSIVW